MALVAYPVWGNKFDSGHRKLSPGFNLSFKYTSPGLGAQEKKLHKLPGMAHLILAVFGFLNILYFLPFILYNNKKALPTADYFFRSSRSEESAVVAVTVSPHSIPPTKIFLLTLTIRFNIFRNKVFLPLRPYFFMYWK